MNEKELIPGEWYWLRLPDGQLRPHRFYRLRQIGNERIAEFYVGSMLTKWSTGCIVGKAEMPHEK